MYQALGNLLNICQLRRCPWDGRGMGERASEATGASEASEASEGRARGEPAVSERASERPSEERATERQATEV